MKNNIHPDFESFKREFIRHHICGIGMMPRNLCYATWCPRCEPNLPQWQQECIDTFNRGQIEWNGYYWQTPKAS